MKLSRNRNLKIRFKVPFQETGITSSKSKTKRNLNLAHSYYSVVFSKQLQRHSYGIFYNPSLSNTFLSLLSTTPPSSKKIQSDPRQPLSFLFTFYFLISPFSPFSYFQFSFFIFLLDSPRSRFFRRVMSFLVCLLVQF